MTSFTVKPEGSVWVKPLSIKQEGKIAFVFKGKPMHCLPACIIEIENDKLVVEDETEQTYSFVKSDTHWLLKSSLSVDSLLHGTEFVVNK